MIDVSGGTAGRAAHRDNNFGALRLLFAVLVLYSHSYPLVAQNEREPLVAFTGGKMAWGGVAVDGFFLISGCLITQSWLRSRSPSEFIVRRCLRIYPGYLAAFALSLVVAVAASAPHSRDYLENLLRDNDKLLRSLTFLDYGALDKAPAFPGNALRPLVNGSLWTLHPEAQCYALTLLLGAFGLAGGRRVSVAIALASYAIYAANCLEMGTAVLNLSRFTTFFFLGASAASGAFGVLRPTPFRMLAAGGLLALSARSPTALCLAYPPAFAVLLFGVAHSRFAPGAALFARHDLSYGVYLYSFLVQQAAIHFLHVRSAMGLFAVSLPITLALALASWRLVERPALEWARPTSVRPRAMPGRASWQSRFGRWNVFRAIASARRASR